MSPAYETITFMSDYGAADEFVGVVHAVVRDLAPQVRVIDLTHEIPPYDVRAGSLTLARSIAYIPRGIVMAVVDPGVGTSRRAIAVQVAGGEGILLGPDNGLLAPAVAMAGGAERAVELSATEFHLVAPGATFAGRDVFAPVAAHLCNGVDLGEFGSDVDPAGLMPATVPLPRTEGDLLLAEVLWVDRYGNCQLNVGPDEIDGWGPTIDLRIGRPGDPGGVVERSALRTTNFEQIAPGGLGLVLDSYGMMAICASRRSAAVELGLGPGEQVALRAGEGAGGAVTPVTLRSAPQA